MKEASYLELYARQLDLMMKFGLKTICLAKKCEV